MCKDLIYKILELVAECSHAVLPYLAVVWIIVVQHDLVAMGDSLTLMDTHLTLRGINTTHGHLIQ